MRKCSTSLAIRVMQIKITIRHHYTSTRIAKIKNTDKTKGWPGGQAPETLRHRW